MSSASNAKTYLAKLCHRRTVAAGTMAFHFDKPAGLTFTPGQFVELTLLHRSDPDPAQMTRALSIASAPHEATLMVATRLRPTAFKRELQQMPIGTAVQIEGPFGNLVLHSDQTRPAVFLAGGIGITPFRSMVFHAAMQRSPQRLVLFYSNRKPEDAPFLDELLALQEKNPQYVFVGTMTEPEQSALSWNGETGYLTAALLSKQLADIPSPTYYVVGPPGMVTALRTVLKEIQVHDRDIRTEKFVGY
jgi:ferredoxin-NADP reductase